MLGLFIFKAERDTESKMRTYFLRLVHYIIALGEFLQNFVLRVSLYATFGFSKKWAPKIQDDSKQLKKIPSHVGIIVTEDSFSFNDLANIIIWSISLGISYITVYDINGEIKRNDAIIKKSLERSKKEVMGQDQSNYDIQLFSSSQSKAETSLCSTAGKSRKAYIHLLCVENGQRQIVDVARRVSSMVTSGACKREDIVPDTVDKFFQESLRCPDPELCLKFGSSDCLSGYLPWQIRLTEIISMPSHKDIEYKTFLTSMIKFANTSQRFGK